MSSAATAALPSEDAVRPEDVLRPEEEWPYHFALIPLDQLFVDKRYQRPLSSFYKEVCEKFKPSQVGTLTVAPRGKNGDRFAVIDGQTRMEGVRERIRRDLHAPANMPCLVYTDLRKGEEAQLFADLQTKRRGMTTYHRFRAQLVAAEAQPVSQQAPEIRQAAAVAKVTTEAGFELGVEQKPNTMRAIAALERLYSKGEEHLAQVLDICRESWGTDNHEAVSAEMLRGISWFLLGQDNVDEERLIERLSSIEPSMLKHRASSLRAGKLPGSGSGMYMGQAILNLYMERWR